MTEKQYRSHPAISRSDLFRITESPEKFKYYIDNPQPPTPALLFGQAFHKLALEPKKFKREFAVCPECDRRTTEGKLIYAEFLKKSKKKTVIPSEDYEKIQGMCDALNRNEYVKRLLNGERETPFFWTDEITGEACKCRTDCLSTVGENYVITDVKSAMNASTENFMRDAVKYGYDFQAAMYSEGVKAVTGIEPLFVFIVVEKEPPYAVNIFQADPIFKRRGQDIFRELIGVYRDCKQTGNWYGYLGKFNMINNLSLPAWLAKEIE